MGDVDKRSFIDMVTNYFATSYKDSSDVVFSSY